MTDQTRGGFVPTVPLPGLGVGVLDGGVEALIHALRAQLREAPPSQSVLVVAVHVGGLLHRHDEQYVSAIREASIVYADGNSVVALARLAGAKNIRRSVTTDVGWDMIACMSGHLGRRPRLAAIGGRPGLAEAAARQIALDAGADVAFTTHGFHEEWESVITELASKQPDVLILGLGVPKEATWAVQYRSQLPRLVITCGGWFGYIVGHERRAPAYWRRLGLEWLYRLLQDPRRLAARYARGMGAVIAIAGEAIRHRRG